MRVTFNKDNEMEDVERKYSIRAVNKNKENPTVHTEADSVLFLAKDKHFPSAVVAYIQSMRMDPEVGEAQIQSAELMLERIERYQREVGVKTPDIDDGWEFHNCLKDNE